MKRKRKMKIYSITEKAEFYHAIIMLVQSISEASVSQRDINFYMMGKFGYSWDEVNELHEQVINTTYGEIEKELGLEYSKETAQE